VIRTGLICCSRKRRIDLRLSDTSLQEVALKQINIKKKLFSGGSNYELLSKRFTVTARDNPLRKHSTPVGFPFINHLFEKIRNLIVYITNNIVDYLYNFAIKLHRESIFVIKLQP
jgi:hypothetical protein